MDDLLVLIIIITIAVTVDKKIQSHYKKKGTDGMSTRIFFYGTFIFIFLVIKFFLTSAKY